VITEVVIPVLQTTSALSTNIPGNYRTHEREGREKGERYNWVWFCVITEVVIPVLQATSSLSTKIPGYWTELKMRGREWRKEEGRERGRLFIHEDTSGRNDGKRGREEKDMKRS
jgi:hypothetical protein